MRKLLLLSILSIGVAACSGGGKKPVEPGDAVDADQLSETADGAPEPDAPEPDGKQPDTGDSVGTPDGGEDAAVPDEIVEPDDVLPTELPCVPDCEGKNCGEDGCGGTCGSCTGFDVCGEDGVCTAPPCQSSKDCPGDLVCNQGKGQCVECLGNEDCGEDAICGPDSKCVAVHKCVSDKDCKDWDMVCAKELGYCVECLAHPDCLDTEFCKDTFCLPDVCVGGEQGCDGNVVGVCLPDGSAWQQVQACQASQYCEGGVCFDQVCPPAGKFCDGEKVMQCDAIGKAAQEVVDCSVDELHCVDGECLDVVCIPDSMFCSDDMTPALCGSDGMVFQPQAACVGSTFCFGGNCVPWKCTPGGAVCNGNVATVCNTVGSGPVPGGKDCSADGLCCYSGECKPPAEEICDGIDNDCDAKVDEGCDADGDGWCGQVKQVVGNPPICPNGGGDCDDKNADIHPGQPDVPGDLVDNNCNGAVDEGLTCAGTCTGHSVEAYLCALELCYQAAPIEASFSSPTGDQIDTAWEAVAHFGNPNNDLAPKAGSSYGLLASGTATGTAHSTDLPGGNAIADPYAKDGYQTYDNVEFKLKMKAPPGAVGFAIDFIFMSVEYEEYVGSSFNDKFYVFLTAPATTGGQKVVINSAACSNPNAYYDFIDPGTGEKRCYIAINTAFSEPCSAPSTDISGTGYECGPADSSHGSSTGWLTTKWPVAAGEQFELVFHIHDASDGIFDSEVILDRFQWLYGPFTPGTFPWAP